MPPKSKSVTKRPRNAPREKAQNYNNVKHRLFVCEYLVDLDAGAAYVRAGYKVKNEQIAQIAANRLLKTVYVQAMIDEAIRKRCAEIDIGGREVVERLNRVYLESMAVGDHTNAVAALREMGKHFGIYEANNKQKRYSPDDISAIKARLTEAGMDFSEPNKPALVPVTVKVLEENK